MEESVRQGLAHRRPRPLRRRNGRLYVLRGRVRCALCGRRMEGSHQKHANWYRCRFEANRGNIAADVAGHPCALQIKEEIILDELVEFMGRRLFGPQWLRLLRDELARSVAESWREHDTQLARLRLELEDTDRSLYRQSLRLEEHDDANHPVVALATRRIEELSARRASTEATIQTLEATRPHGARPAEIEALLAAVPDLRPALKSAGPEELVDLFEAFDVCAVYDKPNHTLELAATVTPELVADNEKPRPTDARSGISSIAGAGFEPAGGSELKRTPGVSYLNPICTSPRESYLFQSRCGGGGI